MGVRKKADLELSDREFERLLALVDLLDEVQLLRLQCKVAALIGDPPQWTVGGWAPERKTDPPPTGLSGVYAPPAPPPPADTYEELDFEWEDEPDDGGV